MLEVYTIFMNLWKNYAREYTALIIIAIIFLALSSFAEGSLVYHMKPLFDKTLLKNNIQYLNSFFVSIILLATLKIISMYIYKLTTSIVSNRLSNKMSYIYFSKVIYFSNKILNRDKFNGNNLLQYQLLISVPQFIDAFIFKFCRNIGLIITFSILIFKVTPIHLAFMYFVVFLLLFIPYKIVVSKLKKFISQMLPLQAEFLSYITNLFQQNLNSVKIYTKEEWHIQKVNKLLKRRLAYSYKLAIASSIISPLNELLIITLFLVSLYYGIHYIQKGEMTIGAFVALFSALLSLSRPIRSFANDFVTLKTLAVNINTLMNTLNIKNCPDERTGSKIIPKSEKINLELKNVCFQYSHNTAEVLSDVSFKIESGDILGIIGESGSGKSSLVALLPRLYSPTKGDIFFNNINIKEINIKNLRSHYAIVNQKNVLYNMSIKENIAYGLPYDIHDINNIPIEKVMQAAKLARCHDFIMQLPEQYNTVINSLSSNLSGGQLQRIVLAQAIISDAPIIILDEATSALDPENKEQINNTIIDLKKTHPNKIFIIISHSQLDYKIFTKMCKLSNGKVNYLEVDKKDTGDLL